MYAVITTGGKQYKVKEGEKVRVEKLEGNVGDTLTFDKVLFIGTDAEPKIGAPYLDGVKVDAKISAQDRARKIIVYKKKRRKGFEKRSGHRQPYTELEITKIVM
ncbi:MAG: 50S ribosomal protein L21 [Deltaproteobacteria bacterium CG07_land_8_20_14_0_80_38_7]|nr:MAG: 50S ribosomal protein L21 [Deltaproteobacteria bacterium CG07_land_8_20_14_0_80_38_7]